MCFFFFFFSLFGPLMIHYLAKMSDSRFILYRVINFNVFFLCKRLQLLGWTTLMEVRIKTRLFNCIVELGFHDNNDHLFFFYRMLLHVPTLQRRRSYHHQRAMPQLHLSRLDAHVFPQGLPVRQTHRPRLPDRETVRPVLPHHHLS